MTSSTDGARSFLTISGTSTKGFEPVICSECYTGALTSSTDGALCFYTTSGTSTNGFSLLISPASSTGAFISSMEGALTCFFYGFFVFFFVSAWSSGKWNLPAFFSEAGGSNSSRSFMTSCFYCPSYS